MQIYDKQSVISLIARSLWYKANCILQFSCKVELLVKWDEVEEQTHNQKGEIPDTILLDLRRSSIPQHIFAVKFKQTIVLSFSYRQPN